jgi:hypothetical protein
VQKTYNDERYNFFFTYPSPDWIVKGPLDYPVEETPFGTLIAEGSNQRIYTVGVRTSNTENALLLVMVPDPCPNWASMKGLSRSEALAATPFFAEQFEKAARAYAEERGQSRMASRMKASSDELNGIPAVRLTLEPSSGPEEAVTAYWLFTRKRPYTVLLSSQKAASAEEAATLLEVVNSFHVEW